MGLLPVSALQHPAHIDVDVVKEFTEWTDEKILKKALITGITDDVDVSPFGTNCTQPFDLKRFGKISKGQIFLIKSHEMPAAKLDKYFKETTITTVDTYDGNAQVGDAVLNFDTKTYRIVKQNSCLCAGNK